MPLISSASPGDPLAQNPLDLLRPGSPPPHVITVSQVHVLRLFTEDRAEQFLANYPARAVEIQDQAAIHCLAAASLTDLGRDRATIAPFLKKHRWIGAPSWTLRITTMAEELVGGAGIRIADLRGQEPSPDKLAELLADSSIVGIYLSLPEPARLAWVVLLKAEPIRLLQDRGLLQLKMRRRRFARKQLFGPLGPLDWLQRQNRSLRAWISELEVTASLLLRLATLGGTVILILRAVGVV